MPGPDDDGRDCANFKSFLKPVCPETRLQFTTTVTFVGLVTMS